MDVGARMCVVWGLDRYGGVGDWAGRAGGLADRAERVSDGLGGDEPFA